MTTIMARHISSVQKTIEDRLDLYRRDFLSAKAENRNERMREVALATHAYLEGIALFMNVDVELTFNDYIN